MAARLIPYAGRDATKERGRRIDSVQAQRLRAEGMTWRQVAMELSLELDPWTTSPFTADGVSEAVRRLKCRSR